MQCQGSRPANQKEIQNITRIVSEHYKPNDLTYEKLIRLFELVKQETRANGKLLSLDELGKKFEGFNFPKNEVVKIIQFIAGDDSMTEFVTETFTKNNYAENGINFKLLKLITNVVRIEKGLDISTDIVAQLKADLIRREFPVWEKDDIITCFVKNLQF
ncbi:uncharacterized protein LOC126842256 [Adelges cooleyi]|uniref:uncharacterized protein LOC126842256 n=1 Tax=Adelges cooleyi TaxID=133065 RepID=UPI0021800FB0|nr:uncharacterized protein LOC126842256 [Adelges cooleyi]